MIVLEAVPAQSLSVQIVGRRFDLRIFDLGEGHMAADVAINGDQILTACRLVAGTPVIPFAAMEDGNLIIVTDGSDPDWRRFGVDQWLVSLDEAAGPVVGGNVASGGGVGPGPGPSPVAYLERARNLSDLLDKVAARVNLDVYDRATIDLLQAALDALAAEVAALPTPPATASVAEFRAGSGSGYVSPAVGSGAVAFVAITRASAAGGLDFDNFVNASIMLDANLTVSGWIKSYEGASGIIRFVQDATGGRTVAWASGYIVPAGFALQATANGVTDVPYVCEPDNKIRLYNPSKWVA